MSLQETHESVVTAANSLEIKCDSSQRKVFNHGLGSGEVQFFLVLPCLNWFWQPHILLPIKYRGDIPEVTVVKHEDGLVFKPHTHILTEEFAVTLAVVCAKESRTFLICDH